MQDESDSQSIFSELQVKKGPVGLSKKEQHGQPSVHGNILSNLNSSKCSEGALNMGDARHRTAAEVVTRAHPIGKGMTPAPLKQVGFSQGTAHKPVLQL